MYVCLIFLSGKFAKNYTKRHSAHQTLRTYIYVDQYLWLTIFNHGDDNDDLSELHCNWEKSTVRDLEPFGGGLHFAVDQ